MNNRKTWLENETIKKANFDVEGQVKSMSEDKKVEKKIYYRFACALILIAAATGMFAWV